MQVICQTFSLRDESATLTSTISDNNFTLDLAAIHQERQGVSQYQQLLQSEIYIRLTHIYSSFLEAISTHSTRDCKVGKHKLKEKSYSVLSKSCNQLVPYVNSAV